MTAMTVILRSLKKMVRLISRVGAVSSLYFPTGAEREFVQIVH